MINIEIHPSSYRDPAGFVFKKHSLFYRQVNKSYAADYGHLISSGLYDDLVKKELLLPHTEINKNLTDSADWYQTILPEQLSFISYPYEWCFSQLRDAALLTLSIQKISLTYGMSLKDATFFNIQFHKGKPVFIDTLSFEKYDESLPWIAYRQFCECFLYPLYIQKYIGGDAQKLLLSYPEGIPVALAKSLLPWKSNFNLGIWLHVILPSKIKPVKESVKNQNTFDRKKMLHLITNLQDVIKGCVLNDHKKTVWNTYYDETILSKSYLAEKEIVFREIIDGLEFSSVLDIGANDGFFSKIIAEKNTSVTSIDFDAYCIDRLYNHIKQKQIKNILPLCVDYSNPTPATGFEHEHASFAERVPDFDLGLALALIHHLAISKNIPLQNIAASFQRIAKKILVEFVPKEDEKVQQLLQHRKDIYPDYSKSGFENAFGQYFNIEAKKAIPGTHRIMYLLIKKEK